VAQWELRTGTGVDRLLNFSDAVVAVAITVLALPLVDIAGPSQGQTVVAVLNANSGSIVTFISTFFVVAIMWSVHNRIMNALGSYDAPVFWLSMCWLIGFVILPWPATMFGGGDDWGVDSSTPFDSDGTGLLYWWTLAYISGIGSIAMVYISRHPRLLKPEYRQYWGEMRTSRARFRGVSFFIVFIVAGLATLVYSYWGFLALFLIYPLDVILRPSRAERERLALLQPDVDHGGPRSRGSTGPPPAESGKQS
jgi:uncharacterized membrane protein